MQESELPRQLDDSYSSSDYEEDLVVDFIEQRSSQLLKSHQLHRKPEEKNEYQEIRSRISQEERLAEMRLKSAMPDKLVIKKAESEVLSIYRLKSSIHKYEQRKTAP